MGLLSTIKEYSKTKKIPEDFTSVLKNDFRDFKLNLESEKIITKEIGLEATDFVKKHINIVEDTNFLVATTTTFNIDRLPNNRFDNIINLKKINDARYVNKFFEAVNSKLGVGGLYINCVETYTTRRERIIKKYVFPLNRIFNFMDVVFMRVLPKLPIAKKVYFYITKGRNRVLTRAETFGRMYSCGFEILDQKKINNKLYFIAKKIKEPVFDNNPSYGMLVRLRRVGKEGKVFNVFKLRTMHAYAEYLQEYVHMHNSLKEGGKFQDDFRITNEGKFFRKFWLDELPMIINLLKGDMKLVGVRPLSKHYFGLYTKELQEERIKTKPGLVPPFYADMPKNLEEIIQSELKYLRAYEKSPIKTDLQYFYKAFYNIFLKGARSS